MYRLTARILLTLVLAGTFTPLALAISAPAPHACCMRKPMLGEHAPASQFSASSDCCNHDCCKAVTISRWARLAEACSSYSSPRSSGMLGQFAATFGSSGTDALRSGRSPPHFFFIA
jgi:hypothetical protein